VKDNPFHSAYLTDSISAGEFIKLFSPMLLDLPNTQMLYEPGNLVVSGLQGTGKTMLLHLLKPEIRIAYSKNELDFPVSKQSAKFISAGINFRKVGAPSFGHALEQKPSEKEIANLVLMFGDFVNLWLVVDLFSTILKYIDNKNDSLLNEVGINNDITLLNAVVKKLSKNNCWYGYFDNFSEVNDVHFFLEKLNEKIYQYRKVLNMNQELSSVLKFGKTDPGIPIIRTVEILKEEGILDNDTNVHLRIDQYEDLDLLDETKIEFGKRCQEIIHSMMYTREGIVSIKLGSRKYSWPKFPRVFATAGCLEQRRDYQQIDIDDFFAPKEHSNKKTFEHFATDIFIRRLKYSGYELPLEGHSNQSPLERVFGVGMTPEDKIRHIAPSDGTGGKNSLAKLIKYEDSWSSSWKERLQAIYSKDVLQGKYAESWVRQVSEAKKSFMNVDQVEPYPWTDKISWKNDRVNQALVQIAARNEQALIYFGARDIIQLSGSNIFVFLTLCQKIWDSWNTSKEPVNEGAQKEKVCPSSNNFSIAIQTVGVRSASREFLRKIDETENSKIRSRVVKNFGRYFNYKLKGDIAMSNPGHYAFSLTELEIEDNEQIRKFLEIAVNNGDFKMQPHASKDAKRRIKYCLMPILCPEFNLPFIPRTEPEYIKPSRLVEWINVDEVPLQTSKKSKDHNQIDLFGESDA